MPAGDGWRSGWASKAAMGEEATIGTYAATAGTAFTFNTFGLKADREKSALEAVNGTRNPLTIVQGIGKVGGPIEINADPSNKSLGLFLRSALGGSTTAIGVAGSGFTHTFHEGDTYDNVGTAGAAVHGLSFVAQYGETLTSCFAFRGCKVNQLTIKGEMGQPVKVTADVIGMGATATNSIPAYASTSPAVIPYMFDNVTILQASSITSITTGGGTAMACQSFELTINNNFVGDGAAYQLGSAWPAVLPVGRREVTLKLTQRYDTSSAYDMQTSDTVSAIRIKLANASTCGSAAGATTYALWFDLPKVKWVSPLPELGDAGVITTELSGMTFVNTVSGEYVIRATVGDAVAQY